LEFGVWGPAFGVWGLGFRVWGMGYGVWSLRFGFQFGVWGLGFWVRGHHGELRVQVWVDAAILHTTTSQNPQIFSPRASGLLPWAADLLP